MALSEKGLLAGATGEASKNQTNPSKNDAPNAGAAYAFAVEPEISVLEGQISKKNGELVRFEPINTNDGKDQSRTIDFSIKNEGFKNLAINGGITITGGDSSSFTLTETTPPNVITPDSVRNFSVSFKPVATSVSKVFKATLEINSDDADESKFSLNLEGEVMAPEISVTEKPDKAIQDQKIAFDLINVGNNDTRTPKIFTILNKGKATLTITEIEIDGMDVASFELVKPMTPAIPFTLDPGSKYEFQVTFKPDTSAPKNFEAALFITSNAEESKFSADLEGTVN
ncbi:MAG: choice-of-anchor D domain-containing protein [Akkermansiaceae bacterium]|nr:choice-of-anchor D domain-containing protein [Akkermansiaceae bacterium]